MIGRFLEISIETPDITASVEFYQGLGLVQATVGDVWSHRYGVVTDGHLTLGLHEYSFPSPALTYVHPDLEKSLGELRRRAGELAFAKTGDDEFNEAGFTDPDGHMVAVLEARTFSPPEISQAESTILGHFSEYSLPVSNLDASVSFWEDMGFVMIERQDAPMAWASLTSDFLNLGLYVAPLLRAPALTFREEDMAQRIEYVRAQHYSLAPGTPISPDRAAGATLLAPEGTQIFLLPETSA